MAVAAAIDAAQAVVVRDVVHVPVLAPYVDATRAESRRRVQIVAVAEPRVPRRGVVGPAAAPGLRVERVQGPVAGPHVQDLAAVPGRHPPENR